MRGGNFWFSRPTKPKLLGHRVNRDVGSHRGTPPPHASAVVCGGVRVRSVPYAPALAQIFAKDVLPRLFATLCIHNAPSDNAKNGKGHGDRSCGDQGESESTKAESNHSQGAHQSQGAQTAPFAKKANPKHQTSAEAKEEENCQN